MSLSPGDAAPDFTLPTDGDGAVTLSALKGGAVVVYFYPKDNTPGCTKEAEAFRDMEGDFAAANTKIIGISKDSVARHDKFKAKFSLNFTLAADEEGEVCEKFGIWVEKNLYGRKYMGIERSTFLIDKTGAIQEIWRKVRVKGHVEKVLDAAKAL
ncbi:MAG: thioredoxin-dependent thiol peroxidase [Alphaproteobacteria bacterium]|nr:thioredoxin-dependent thiol peroxidase [Alphaproteobacteria bacterium]